MIDLDKFSLFEELKNALTPLETELQELKKYENATHKNVMGIVANKLKENEDV
jgi:hypothetical protein